MGENEWSSIAVVEDDDARLQPNEEVETLPLRKSTSPAFQFYPKDFLSSRRVENMTMAERGIYITLLCRCWDEDGLPTDLSELASMVRMKPAPFAKLWANSAVRHCFAERGGKLHNERLDRERKAQAEYRKRQKDKAEKRWDASRSNAVAMPRPERGNALQSASSSAICNLQSAEEEISSETESVSEPALLTFTTVGKSPTWVLTASRVAEWANLYPSLDVEAECRKALAWVVANPDRRKTTKGMPAFLVNWLNRAADRGGASAQSAPGLTNPRSKTAGNVAALQSFVDRMSGTR